MTRDLSDPNDTWWTIDQAADHFQITRGAIRRWIREEGVTVYGGRMAARMVRRADILAAFRARRQRQLATRRKPHDSGPAQT